VDFRKSVSRGGTYGIYTITVPAIDLFIAAGFLIMFTPWKKHKAAFEQYEHRYGYSLEKERSAWLDFLMKLTVDEKLFLSG